MKVTEQYFPVVLFVLTLWSVDEIPKILNGDRSHEICSALFGLYVTSCLHLVVIKNVSDCLLCFKRPSSHCGLNI